ncbi:MAG: hypothetical protein AB2795_21075 [Candidatus Thiodiazotropha endolucinida]
MNHKIVCWRHYAIPVPVWAKWMARDKNGGWYVYSTEPKRKRSIWNLDGIVEGSLETMVSDEFGLSIAPPEPGPWTDQLYWIGD